MAGIASTRIASGSGVFHKPQASDIGEAGGADASSPFDQLLGAPSAGPGAAPPVDGQAAQDQPDTGKKASKDANNDGKAGQVQQATVNQIIAGAQALLQADAANDDKSVATNSSGDITVGAASDAGTAQNSALPAQQATPNADQASVAAQIPLPSPNDAESAPTPDGKDGDPLATLLGSDTRQSATNAPGMPSESRAAGDDSSDTGANAVTAASRRTSLISSDKHERKDAIPGESRPEDVLARADLVAQSDAPLSGTKKESKSAKAQDQSKPADADRQTASPDSAAAMAASAAPPPAAAVTSDTTRRKDVAAVDAAAPAKNAAKNSLPGSNPPAGSDGPAQSDPSVNDGSKAQQAASGLPNGAPSPNGFTPQAINASQGGGKPAASAGDKGDKQAAAAPAQPVAAQTVQPAQPQAPQPAILPSGQQIHASGAPAVTQNVQVSQPDANSTANTVGALAVAIAAKSQSGNKQFDIRLDPPELGRVEVRLSIDATGKAQASLSADQPRTLDMLKTDAPVLARALRDAGLNVAQNGLNFSLRGQDRQNGGNAFTPRSNRASHISLTATSAIGSVPGGAHYQGPADGRLDIRV